MNPLFRQFVVCAALGAACFTPAAQALDPQVWAAARADFDRALQGESGKAEDAADQFARLLAAEPANPLVLAYHGSAMAMRGRDSWAPWKKMKYAEAGLADLDRALALLKPEHAKAPAGAVPVASEVKLTAASTFLGLPGFFNRGPAGEKLARELAAQPGLAGMPQAYRDAVVRLAPAANGGAK